MIRNRILFWALTWCKKKELSSCFPSSAGLLLPEERATCNPFCFGKVVFQHITDAKNGITVPAKPDMTPGRIYLTNKRLILLAIEDTKGEFIRPK